jgi:PiT family inorganic phosphate transporter
MWIWLSSGLLLGWSLGANDAANVFGAAVAARMVRFSTAVTLCVVFVILGGLINGPSAMETIGHIGRINSLAGAFATALAAGITVAAMTWAGFPVSTSQAAIGALIGYQLAQYGTIDDSVRPLLNTVVITWVACPVLAAMISFLTYRLVAYMSRSLPMPLLILDRWLRSGLLIAGCYGAWSLGGNNMANVVGFYTTLDLFDPVQLGSWSISQSRLLSLLGGLAISLGVATFSYRVMLKVGRDLVRLDAMTAFIAILAEALVVDYFSHSWKFGTFVLPAIPVSTSQALVGGVLGIGLARGIQTIKMRVLFNIAVLWIVTPIVGATLAYAIMPVVIRLAGT